MAVFKELEGMKRIIKPENQVIIKKEPVENFTKQVIKKEPNVVEKTSQSQNTFPSINQLSNSCKVKTLFICY